ncbi:MAG: MerR family transcriptional regulator [Clostridium sp.]|nr:MerR family transcriptional regulator [Clostridium sp.]
MYRIGLFSKYCSTSIKTLRYYDEVGLLKPKFIDEENGYRYYTTEQLFKFHSIQSYRQIGLSIDEIRLILDGGESDKKIIENRKKELIDEKKSIEEQLLRIKFLEEGKDDETYMNYHAVVKELPECIVYSKKLTISCYDDLFNVIPKIGETMLKANPEIKCTEPAYCYIQSLDGEYKEKDINIEFCEAVDRFGNCVDGIEFKKIESVTGVSVMHKGSYKEFGLAYAYLFNWIEKNNYVVLDSPREMYIDGVWNKDSEDEWLTEIQVPVKKL